MFWRVWLPGRAALLMTSQRAPVVFPDLRCGLFLTLGKVSKHINCFLFEARGCCGGEVLANRGFIIWWDRLDQVVEFGDFFVLFFHFLQVCCNCKKKSQEMTLCVCGLKRKKEKRTTYPAAGQIQNRGHLAMVTLLKTHKFCETLDRWEASCSCSAPSHSTTTIHFSLTGWAIHLGTGSLSDYWRGRLKITSAFS